MNFPCRAGQGGRRWPAGGHGGAGNLSLRLPGQQLGIAETEELRTVVLDASSRLSRLLTGLKLHRRQSRAVQAAMQSLKQLKLDT